MNIYIYVFFVIMHTIQMRCFNTIVGYGKPSILLLYVVHSMVHCLVLSTRNVVAFLQFLSFLAYIFFLIGVYIISCLIMWYLMKEHFCFDLANPSSPISSGPYQDVARCCLSAI